MKFNTVVTDYCYIDNDKVRNNLSELSNMYTNEYLKKNKVAFYYEDKNNTFSFNKDIGFYAASAIKILVCLYLYKLIDEDKVDINEKILVKLEDLKQDTGIIKYNTEDKEYTIKELIRLCIVESDNTAYIKLVNYVTKEKLEEYGKSLGAIHTMEGKDLFGLITCSDMIIYWKEVKKYIETGKHGKEFKDYLSNPSVKLINCLDNNYVRKYGSWDIAYHEAGYVESDNEYYLIILTQLNKEDYKEEFINKTAKLLDEINKELNK